MCPCRNFQPRNMFARTNGPPIVGTGLGAAALWPAEVTKCTARPIPMIPKDWSEGRALIRFYPGLFFSNIPILRRFCTPWIKVKVEGRGKRLKTNTIHHFLWAELRVLLRCVSPAGNVNWTAPMTQSCANATTGCPCDAGQREGFTEGNLEVPKPEVWRFPIHGGTPKSSIYRWIFHSLVTNGSSPTTKKCGGDFRWAERFFLRMSSGRTSAQTPGDTAGAVPRPTRAPSLVLRTSRRGKMGQVAGLFTI